MIDPSLVVVEPWDTEPTSTAGGFIDTEPGCLTNHQQLCLQRLRVLTVDHNEEYLAKHPQVEALMRVLIGSLANNRPANPRDFIRKVVEQNDLETKVAKMIIMKRLDPNTRHTRHYWENVPKWEEKVTRKGKAVGRSSDWPGARPHNPSETVMDTAQHCHLHQLKAPGLFFPTEMMMKKKLQAPRSPIKTASSEDDLLQEFHDSLLTDSSFDKEEQPPVWREREESSSELSQVSAAKSETSFDKKFNETLDYMDRILFESKRMLNEFSEGCPSSKRKKKKLIKMSEEQEEDQKFKTLVTVKARKTKTEVPQETSRLSKAEESETSRSTIPSEQPSETSVHVDFIPEKKDFQTMLNGGVEPNIELRPTSQSFIWIAPITDSEGNIIIEEKVFLHPASDIVVKSVGSVEENQEE